MGQDSATGPTLCPEEVGVSGILPTKTDIRPQSKARTGHSTPMDQKYYFTNSMARIWGREFPSSKTTAGSAGHLGMMDWQRIKSWTTPSWLRSILQQAQHLGIEFHDPYRPLPLKRVHDQFIMSAISQMQFQVGQLRQLNWCRMFVWATTLADIISADGKQITQEAWTGQSPTFPFHDPTYPKLPPRNQVDWACWQTALGQLVHSPRSRLL